jgi:D-serine dehydratase
MIPSGASDPGPDFLLDDRMRGFPAGHAPVAASRIAELGLKPFDGAMSLPLISLDLDAFDGNAAAMLGYVRAHGAAIAPHAKTPMSPALARRLAAAGAWGASVADIRQASVLLRAGIGRLILANEIGGRAAARRLAAAMAGHPEAELFVFADSPLLVEALAAAWAGRDDLPRLGLLPELGLARGGARTVAEAEAVAEAALAAESGRFRLAGVAAYEGSAATGDPAETRDRIGRLMGMVKDLFARVRARVGADRPLVMTAGGSSFFDLVTEALGPAAAADGRAELVLRSGAIFFHDHGIYERSVAALDLRAGFGPVPAAASFRPALRVWAEVLSRPEPGVAVCGMGHRDVAMDQDLPRPLACYRDGGRIGGMAGAAVARLNDQHAFLDLPAGSALEVGDVVEFGISHPCTCLDRHGVVYGLDRRQAVTTVFPTCFG